MEDDPTLKSARSGTDADTLAEGSVGHHRQVARSLRDRLANGATLGRYVVEDQVGEGGMGVVYAAFDPELKRRVALKLLQPDLGRRKSATDGRARLLREAQAIARLSHPNVIHVYDVGTFEDHVFLALEFVDGEHVGRWLKREKRSWREVLRVFVAAGRGLAAAHAAGIVHRDFKPDNVLIGRDGRVLVTDFGLARAEGDHDPPSVPSSRGSQPSFEPLTAIGAVMGTPGYAAPEHLDGTTGDARSDQFSFAASVFAGVYRKRPYAATSFAAYKQLLAAGIPEPPADSDVPAWVRRVIDRGLAREPAQRYPSMDAFCDALSRDPARTRRRLLAIAAGVVVVGGTSAAIAVTSTRAAEPTPQCTADRLAGVWDASKRAAVDQAFRASDRPFATTVLAGTLARLDERARAWTQMATENCEATRIRGDQPESVMTLRLACLDHRKRELGELVDVLAAADGKVVERAIAATSALSPLADCADVNLLSAIPPPPGAVRARVEDVRAQLAHAKALLDGGKFKDAAAVAGPLVDSARKLEYRPLEAEALMRLGEIQVWLQDAKSAAETLRAATRVAEASRYDEIRARALAWLVGVVGYDLEKPQDGLALAEDARAALERLGGNRNIEAILEGSLGRTYSGTSEYGKMLEHHGKSLELRRAVFGEDDPNTANAYNNVAAALHDLGRTQEALDTHRKAQAIRERVLGKEHPDAAMSMANVGSQYYALGELAVALDNIDAALASARRSLPPTHGTILVSLANRAGVLAELGRFTEAQATYDELFATLAKSAPTSARMGRALYEHAARVLVPTGRGKQALVEADRARELLLAAAGKPTDDVAAAISARARALAALGRRAEAVAAYREAIRITEEVVGQDDPLLVDMLVGLGGTAELERALTICDRRKIGGKWRAHVQLALARAVLPADRARAGRLAAEARGWYASASLDLTEIDALLARSR